MSLKRWQGRPPPSVDLPVEQRRIKHAGLLSGVFCLATLVGMSSVLPMLAEFPADRWERLSFVLRVDLFVAAWVLIGVRLVSRIRFISAEDNPGAAFAPPSPRLAMRAAFLQNTLEQAFLAIIALTALVTVQGEAPLAYALAAALCFSIGRITFLRGYPHGAGGRAFGMVTTVLPTLGAFGWILLDLGWNLLQGAAR